MTTREALHNLIDEMPEEQTEIARHRLEELRNAVDSDGTPIDAKILDLIDRGLADVVAGHTKSFSDYERERGL